MESVQARVQEAITNLMTKLDREHLRKIQVLRSTYSYGMWRGYARLALLSRFYDPEHSDHLILSPGDGVIDIGVDIYFLFLRQPHLFCPIFILLSYKCDVFRIVIKCY